MPFTIVFKGIIKLCLLPTILRTPSVCASSCTQPILQVSEQQPGALRVISDSTCLGLVQSTQAEVRPQFLHTVNVKNNNTHCKRITRALRLGRVGVGKVSRQQSLPKFRKPEPRALGMQTTRDPPFSLLFLRTCKDASDEPLNFCWNSFLRIPYLRHRSSFRHTR